MIAWLPIFRVLRVGRYGVGLMTPMFRWLWGRREMEYWTRWRFGVFYVLRWRTEAELQAAHDALMAEYPDEDD